jgi:hypothetical protein
MLAVGLPAVGLIGHALGRQRSTYVCTVRSVDSSPLRDGDAAWQVRTDCGGVIVIDPSATGQTALEARTLAAELQSGRRYRLTVRGVLHTPLDFSVDLLAAVADPARRS